MPRATQARATHARIMAGACVRYLQRSELDLSRMLLATAALALAPCAHADYYASVGDQWECYDTFQRNQLTPFSLGFVWAAILLVTVGLVIFCRCGKYCAIIVCKNGNVERGNFAQKCIPSLIIIPFFFCPLLVVQYWCVWCLITAMPSTK